MGEFIDVGATKDAAYLALPASGAGPGVLVLHAWWGLTPVFTGVCDRLATEGFVALAPSLYADRATASTIEDAIRLRDEHDEHDGERAERVALAALDYLRDHDAVTQASLGTVGFSLGAWWAGVLSTQRPDDIAAVVLFYGTVSGDFTAARAAFQGHFAETDEWEPLDGVRAMERDLRAAGRQVELHIYPGVGHWFFEPDRPDAYNVASAELAWQRTVTFLRRHASAS